MARASNSRFVFEKDPVGAGGFAKVIKGRDTELERDVAIKILDPLATAFSAADQERFRREARILARLSHPSIPAVYDVEFGDKSFQIIFQFIEGRTLHRVVEDDGPCQLGQAKIWFTQIAAALEHAHQQGIVHRDVKPDNIIISPEGDFANLVDFGIALTAEDTKKLTGSGYAIGTPGYMSPEQQVGDPVDYRTDIYSLGVTLYEALAGHPISLGQYESLSGINEAIPPAVDELVLDCIALVDKRLSSLKEFVVRLSGALLPQRPLSEVLAHGRLHELANAIESLAATDLARLPPGQRALILAKLSDVSSHGERNLWAASESLLTLLLPRGLFLTAEEYRQIVVPAVEWGFEKDFGGQGVGRHHIRVALEAAAHNAKGDAYEVLREEFAAFLKRSDFSEFEDWQLHDVRKMIQTLLANPTCSEGVAQLTEALTSVNRIQRSRTPYSNTGSPREIEIFSR